MKIDLNKRLCWGALAFAPWIIFFTIVPMLLFYFHMTPASDETGKMDAIGIAYLIGENLCVLLVLICYLVYVSRLRTMENRKKRLWWGLMVIGHVFTIPIFWYYYVWKDKSF
jgi:hypothetical protein